MWAQSLDENRHDGAVSVDSEKYVGTNNLEQTQAEVKIADVPPDGGYGWICVACVSLINGHTWGLNSSYGVFLAHYLQANTFPGATALEYAFIGGLSVSMALVVSPLATICVRQFGTRVALLIGVALQTAGLLGASWANQIWHLLLSQGLAFGFGMGFLFVASVGIVPQWFSKKRSFANSIAAAGSGIGGLVYSLGTNAMIQSIGLGWAFRVLAIISCGVNVICTLIVRDRNKAVGSVQIAFDVKLFKRMEFLLLLGWGFFSMLGYIVLLFSLPNYARSIGLTAKQGSIIGAILNLGQGLGRPFVGYFSDAFGRINMAVDFCKKHGVLIFFALIVGTVAGTFWATIGPVGAEVVGIKILPSALSIVWLVLVLPCTFSEPIALELRTTTGDIYLHPQIFTGFMYIGAAICAWFLRAWKVRELEEMALTEVFYTLSPLAVSFKMSNSTALTSLFPTPHGNTTLLLNPSLCTLSTCDLTLAQTAYLPSIPANAFFLSIFSTLLIAQIALGIKTRTYTFTILFSLGLILEIVGYVGRILLHNKPFSSAAFSLQLITLPPFTVKKESQTGTNILLTGLSLHLLTLILFALLGAYFAFQIHQSNSSFPPSSPTSTPLFKLFLAALCISALFITTRTIYLIISLSPSLKTPPTNTEAPFIILESTTATLTILLLTLFHPGLSFQGFWPSSSSQNSSSSSNNPGKRPSTSSTTSSTSISNLDLTRDSPPLYDDIELSEGASVRFALGMPTVAVRPGMVTMQDVAPSGYAVRWFGGDMAFARRFKLIATLSKDEYFAIGVWRLG
ncbi:hypothetical protein G7Y89_g6580 [Cudoniella acicularis]|uniref:Major facilitator superfamily (MFS) profile domain-containing protein n=1 Tax=Cudoniella acicularis TaxID=354080 RepID=A0A8H4RMH3_9HELO|nr:hypothetical protein G7Y89_g6580 [Cudoniella acicularis]